jgi:hypothetical protein
MSKAAQAKSGFKVTVEGDYYVPAAEGRKKKLKPYSIEVILPSMDSALSVIKNKLLHPILKATMPDYINFRTYTITNVEPLGDSKLQIPPSQMSFEQLKNYIQLQGLPVNPEHYSDINTLRADIQLAKDNPSKFTKDVAPKREKEAKEDDELQALNPGIAIKPKKRKPKPKSKPKARRVKKQTEDEDVLGDL